MKQVVEVLPPSTGAHVRARSQNTQPFGARHLTGAFLAGLLTCFLAQYSIHYFSRTPVENTKLINPLLAPPYVGSSEVHTYPAPPSPTNAYPSFFPTNVGYEGPSRTGAEPAVIATAPYYPMHTDAAELVVPGRKMHDKHTKFDLLKHWGHESPWYSVGKGTFGLDSEPDAPKACRITGLHLLLRHGARYPPHSCALSPLLVRTTSNPFFCKAVSAKFAARLNAAASKWNASGDLAFLNEW